MIGGGAVLALSLLLMSGAGSVEAQSADPGSWQLGTGLHSCARWMSDEREDAAGQNWLLGFWSGMNWAKSSRVGMNTDADGIVGEVKRLCLAEPSSLLAFATARVFERMQKEGR